MLDRLRNRFKFILKSTNQHGVHSPFVYRYLTEGIYKTKKDYANLSKQERLLQATLDYFQVQEVLGNLPSNCQIKENAKRNLEGTAYRYLQYISELEQLTNEEIQQLASSITEETLLYIATPHKSKKHLEIWQKLCATNRLHVSIDFYWAGILAVREQQNKEHFTLRM